MNTPLKVVHLNASSAGGAFVVAQRLSTALNNLSPGLIESEHLVFDGEEGLFSLWADSWLKKKWAFGLHALEKLDFLRFERNKSIRFAFSHGKFGIKVSKLKLIAEADIIHLHWINKGFISLKGLSNLIKLNKKIVWTCHDMWPFTGGCYHPRGCENFESGCGNCHYLKHPEAGDLSSSVFVAKQKIYSEKHNGIRFVTPSAWLKHQAERSAMGLNFIDVIPNPIDTDWFYLKDLDSKSGADKNSTFTILFAAANLGNRAKGFAEFRKLCVGLWNSGFENFKALVIGENRIGDLNLPCNYEAVGFVSDPNAMREYYWQSDVFVTTSHEENLPTTIMESLSCGVPVAAFTVGGIPELVDDGVTGWLSELGDVETLVAKLLLYFTSPAEISSTFKVASRSAAVARYDAKHIAQQYLNIYNQSTLS